MSLSNIQLLQATDPQVNQLQVNIKQVLNPLIINPLLGGDIVQFNLAVGDNLIPHGLDQAWQGWFLVDINGTSSVYQNQGSTSKGQFLVLNSSAAVNVSVYVF